MIVTLEILTAAFAAWESDFRSNPGKYLTLEESFAVDVNNMASMQAAHLLGLLRENATKEPA